jgi:integrase
VYRSKVAKTRVDRGIYLLSPGLYEIAVSAGRDPVTGKYRQVFRRHRGNLTSARGTRRALLNEVAEGKHTGTDGTLDDLFDAWLKRLEELKRAPKTIRGYTDDARTYWRPALGSKKVHKIGLRDIETVLDALSARGLSPSTLDHIHACISGAFSQAMRWEWIEKDPTKLVQLPALLNRRPIVPTPQDVAKLITAAQEAGRPEMARVIWLGAITGARNSEIRALRVGDFSDGVMRIDRAISNEVVWETKNRKYRDNALDSLTVRRVEEQVAWMERRNDDRPLGVDAYLFSNDKDGRRHWREEEITKFFSRLADDNGLGQYTFKHLRKFMDTYGQELGFSLGQVADRAGHDPSVAQKHYTSVTKAKDRELSAALATLVDPEGSDSPAL